MADPVGGVVVVWCPSGRWCIAAACVVLVTWIVLVATFHRLSVRPIRKRTGGGDPLSVPRELVPLEAAVLSRRVRFASRARADAAFAAIAQRCAEVDFFPSPHTRTRIAGTGTLEPDALVAIEARVVGLPRAWALWELSYARVATFAVDDARVELVLAPTRRSLVEGYYRVRAARDDDAVVSVDYAKVTRLSPWLGGCLPPVRRAVAAMNRASARGTLDLLLGDEEETAQARRRPAQGRR